MPPLPADPRHGALEKILKALRVGDPRRGTGMITRLATDPALAATTGGYFSVKDAKPLQCPEPGRAEDVQRELWERTAELLRDLVPVGR
ncbi:Rossmann-fold NAD(P)-binding domain-containing protein [Streptacidiphilus sp. PAMC 29251]